MAAGAVLVSEAGGVVLDPNGKDFDIMSRRILVASTPKLAEDWSTKIDFKCHEYERDFPEVYNSFWLKLLVDILQKLNILTNNYFHILCLINNQFNDSNIILKNDLNSILFPNFISIDN